jgi:O-acetyl-ADP-ribose deacetylase (regulator of RNase III)
MLSWKSDGKIVSIERGDITVQKVDAIVNAANPRLAGGGGVDGAIHRAAGPQLPQACRKIIEVSGYLPTGEAVTTSGFNLNATYIIHTVGPVWHGGNNNEPELLKSSYTSSLREAAEKKCSTIAFPAISCGVYGFPTELAVPIALDALFKMPKPIKHCKMIIHGNNDYELWASLACRILGKPEME